MSARLVLALGALAALAGVAVYVGPASGQADGEAAAAFGVEFPAGYRDWRLIAVAHEEGGLNDLRAILGNDIAIEAARSGKLPYPDGAIIARLAWNYLPLAESEKVFGRPQSFVSGSPKNGIQLMVKDSKKFAAADGWGFAEFDDGKPAGAAMEKTCLPCHAAVKERDLVFNRYAP